MLTRYSFQSLMVTRLGTILFISGKLLRFFFFLSFLIILVTKTKVLAGFTLWQIILFYLTFNFIDSACQMFFRDVYRFRQQVVTGSFDFILLKPINPLFRILFGGSDTLDLITLIPFIFMLVFVSTKISGITFFGVVSYILLILNAFVIATSFHIIVVSLAVFTTEIDHAIMMYRDFTGMGRFPIHIYTQPLQSLVTFIIPVGIMMTYPVDALLGLLSYQSIIISFCIGFGFFSFSIFFWKYAIRRYCSASS
jgi:ABC-2 type transport system permease protein